MYWSTQEVLSYVLARSLRSAEAAVRVSRGPHGKPLASAPKAPETSIYVSAARAGGLWVYAVTQIGPIGIDVERAEEQIQPTESWCTEDELTAFSRMPIVQRRRAAVLTWTCKEAVLKAIGTGLSVQPSRLNITTKNELPILSAIDGNPVSNWLTLRLPCGEDYAGTIALRYENTSPAPRVRAFTLNPSVPKAPNTSAARDTAR